MTEHLVEILQYATSSRGYYARLAWEAMPVRRDDNVGKVEVRKGKAEVREGEDNAEAGERMALRAKAKAKTEWGHWGVQKGVEAEVASKHLVWEVDKQVGQLVEHHHQSDIRPLPGIPPEEPGRDSPQPQNGQW